MNEFERWKKEILEPFTKKTKERRAEFRTSSGIEVPASVDPAREQSASLPGEYPFTSGVYPSMYRGRFWTMRQYAGFGTAKSSNERYKELLAKGQTGLSVAFDLPTQMGYDSDHEVADGEVGKVGVAISTMDDMRVLLADMPLEQITTSMTINATAAILLSMYRLVAKERGVPAPALGGTIQNDILKEYIARGTYIYPPKESLRIVADVFEFCGKEMPQWNTISISGYHIREAGSTATQELAFTFANAICYIETALAKGLDVNHFGKRLSFFWNAHNNFFEEIAKYRASRRIYAKLMRERFGATDENALKLRFHTQTAGSTLTAEEIEGNVVRVALQALGAVLGGTQSLHTNSRDEALALPTAESATIALRTQQIIAYETGAADTVDPLAGSHFVEYLTDEIERRVWEYIEIVDQKGGSVRCIEEGYFQDEIARSALEAQKRMESGEDVVVGVNRFRDESAGKVHPPLHKVDEREQQEQAMRVREYKRSRDSKAMARALEALKAAARGSENLVPRIMASLEANATLGEISDALRSVFGVYGG
ncbi:MAG: methylmalonyl-CoA mutase family protein [Planctomycetes bacterium]|nr:methylmalonyl-CoA mutase family protein [Planctomycetota bacterium]